MSETRCKYYIRPDWFCGYRWAVYRRRWLLPDKEMVGLLNLEQAQLAAAVMNENDGTPAQIAALGEQDEQQ